MDPGEIISCGTWDGPLVRSGYIVNEDVLGWVPPPQSYLRARGNLARVRDAAEVMLAADGQPHEVYRTLGVWGEVGSTLGDLSTWHPSNLDVARHRNRVNVLFVDGHAETIPVTVRQVRPVPSAPDVVFGTPVYLSRRPG